MISINIDQADDGKQVHKWLRLLLPGMPLSGIYKFIRTGRIKVNQRRAKRDTVVHTGDEVQLYMTEEDYATTSKTSREKYAGVSSALDVKFEDDGCVVVNKPAGVLVHAAQGNYDTTLQAQVEAYIYRMGPPGVGKAFTPSPVHRLDRNTSGLVVFAKTSSAAREFGKKFDASDVKKTYITLVEGNLDQPGRVDAPLSRENDEVTKIDAAGGRSSVTTYVPIDRANSTSLLVVQIETGRTHQIRAHMAYIGHALVNDAKYGGKRKGQDTFYLHAARLSIPPEFDVSAPLPGKFMRTLSHLGYDTVKVERDLAKLSLR